MISSFAKWAGSGARATTSGIKTGSRWAAAQVQGLWSQMASAGISAGQGRADGATTSAKAGTIGSFGPVVFETSLSYVKTFDRLRERRKARFATHDVLSGDQKLQFLMLELAEVNLGMSFHHAFCTPDEELEALRGVWAGHQAHNLVIGGKAYGEFVMESLSAEIEHANNKGQTLYARADIRLKEYR